MLYQLDGSHCGPAALHNAYLTLGTRHSQRRLGQLAGTTDDEGTTEHGLQRAILATGGTFDEFTTDSQLSAYGWLWHSLTVGRPVLLCTERWGHWVTAVGICGKRPLLFDPARYPYNLERNGLLVVGRDKLLKKWRAERRVRGNLPAYYGLAVSLQ